VSTKREARQSLETQDQQDQEVMLHASGKSPMRLKRTKKVTYASIEGGERKSGLCMIYQTKMVLLSERDLGEESNGKRRTDSERGLHQL